MKAWPGGGCWYALRPDSAKTALLADWARGGGRPAAWLGLEGGDSDPARFGRYAVAALDGVRPGLAVRVGPPLPRSSEGLVTALIIFLTEWSLRKLRDGSPPLMLRPSVRVD